MKQAWGRLAVLAMVAVATASVLCLSGCEDEPPPRHARVTGTWWGPYKLTIGDTVRSGTTMLVLTQDNRSVSGTLGTFPVSGKVSGQKVTLHGTRSGYTFNLAGTVSWNGYEMNLSGTLKNKDATCGFVAALRRYNAVDKEAVAVEGEDLKTAAEALIKAAQ